MKAIALIAAAGIAGVANGSILVDDFDGNGLYSARSIDLGGDVLNSTFAGSIFDVWGITDRTRNFDLADDSAGSFAGDTFGILKTGKTDAVFAVMDLDNPENPGGGGTATWTVDISGMSNLSLEIDFAAMGDFESGDNSHSFDIQIDGGSSQNIFSIDSDDAFDNFVYVLESGNVNMLNDPLFEANTGTYLSNDFQTLSGAIAGTGSTLTITYTAGANNGGGEPFVFDNIYVVPAPASAALLALGGLVATRRR